LKKGEKGENNYPRLRRESCNHDYSSRRERKGGPIDQVFERKERPMEGGVGREKERGLVFKRADNTIPLT